MCFKEMLFFVLLHLHNFSFHLFYGLDILVLLKFSFTTTTNADFNLARSKMTRLGLEGVRAYGHTYVPGSPDQIIENSQTIPSITVIVIGGIRGRTGFLGILGILSRHRGRTGSYRLSGHSIQT